MDFDTAFTKLLGIEGRYTVDKGGPTMWGVTQAVARAWGYMGDMKLLPQSVARAIYKQKYWGPIRADECPDHVRFDIFDAAVNSGPHQAIEWAQESLGVDVDGDFGPETMAAMNAIDSALFNARFNGRRLMFMADLSNWHEDGRGWTRRVAQRLMEA